MRSNKSKICETREETTKDRKRQKKSKRNTHFSIECANRKIGIEDLFHFVHYACILSRSIPNTLFRTSSRPVVASMVVEVSLTQIHVVCHDSGQPWRSKIHALQLKSISPWASTFSWSRDGIGAPVTGTLCSLPRPSTPRFQKVISRRIKNRRLILQLSVSPRGRGKTSLFVKTRFVRHLQVPETRWRRRSPGCATLFFADLSALIWRRSPKLHLHNGYAGISSRPGVET